MDAAVDLERIGFDSHFRAAFAALNGALMPARVAVAHGESYVVWTERGSCKGMLVGRRIADWGTALDRPQVGDWVAGIYSDSSAALLIEHLLARRTCLVRRAAGTRLSAQVLAANIDVVGIVSALGAGGAEENRRLIDERRLERYLAAVLEAHAEPLLIVNKIDLSDDAPSIAEELRRRFPEVPVVLTSAEQKIGLDALGRWLRAGTTLGLLGMSGVGKSTLVNALLGRAAQRVGDVRESDARGRHTTSHRELFSMDNGALLIDMPGTREFGVWEPEQDSRKFTSRQRRAAR